MRKSTFSAMFGAPPWKYKSLGPLLLAALLIGCSAPTLPQPSKPEVSVGQPPKSEVSVGQPSNQAYSLAFNAMQGTDLTQLRFTLKGGSGAGTFMVKLDLPAGVEILRTSTQGSIVTTHGNYLIVFTPSNEATFAIDLTKTDAPISAALVAAESAGTRLDAPISMQVELQGSGALPLTDSTDRQRELFQEEIRKAAKVPTAQSVYPSILVPQIIELPWLKYDAGDVNADDQITLSDSNYVLQALLNRTGYTLDAQKAFAADLVDDGKVDYLDLAALSLKQLAAVSKKPVSVPNVHPKVLTTSTKGTVLSIRNAGYGPLNAEVTANQPWVKLDRLSTNVHPSSQAYLVKQERGVAAGTTAELTVTSPTITKKVAVKASTSTVNPTNIARIEVLPANYLLQTGSRANIRVGAYDSAGVFLGYLDSEQVKLSDLGAEFTAGTPAGESLTINAPMASALSRYRVTLLERPELTAIGSLETVRLQGGAVMLSESLLAFPRIDLPADQALEPANFAPFTVNEYIAALNGLQERFSLAAIFRGADLKVGDKFVIPGGGGITGEVIQIISTRGTAQLIGYRQLKFKETIVNEEKTKSLDVASQNMSKTLAAQGVLSAQATGKIWDSCTGNLASVLDLAASSEIGNYAYDGYNDVMSFDVETKLRAAVNVGMGGSVFCDRTFAEVEVPLPGAFGVFAHLKVGANLEGTATVQAQYAALALQNTSKHKVVLPLRAMVAMQHQQVENAWSTTLLGGDVESVTGAEGKATTGLNAYLRGSLGLMPTHPRIADLLLKLNKYLPFTRVDEFVKSGYEIGAGLSAEAKGEAVTARTALVDGGESAISGTIALKADGGFTGGLGDVVDMLGLNIGAFDVSKKLAEVKTTPSVPSGLNVNKITKYDVSYTIPNWSKPTAPSRVQFGAEPANSLHGKTGGANGGTVTYDFAECEKQGGTLKAKVIAVGPVYWDSVLIGHLPYDTKQELVVQCHVPDPQITVEKTTKTTTTESECSITIREKESAVVTATVPAFDKEMVGPDRFELLIDGSVKAVHPGPDGPWRVTTQYSTIGSHKASALFNAMLGEGKAEKDFTLEERVTTRRKKCGGNAGDPHLSSFDGKRFSFQGVGEYVFARTPDRSFEVQVRFHQSGEQGSVNSAIAMNVAGDRVGFYAMGATAGNAGLALMRLNGQEIPVSLNTKQSMTFPKGGWVDINSNTVRIMWPDGSSMLLNWRGEFFDFVTIGVDQGYMGRLEGLLGNADDVAANDFRGRDGVQYPANPSFEEIYQGFGNSWRIRQDESLFDYAPGQSTATFTNLNFPPPPVPFKAEITAQAQATCTAAGVVSAEAMENCIFDVANTGNPVMASAAANYDPANASVSITPALSEVLPGGEMTLGSTIQGTAQLSEITWQVSAGTIRPSGDGFAIFTAPDTAGVVTITATLRGRSTTAIVDVRSSLINVPARLEIFEGNSTDISAHLTGNPRDVELVWTAQRGSVTGNGLNVTYTAPASKGQDTITVMVKDQPNTAVTITVNVNAPYIKLQPASIEATYGDTVGLNVTTAGFTTAPPLNWSTTGGTLLPGLTAARLTVPAAPGEYVVTATVAGRPELTTEAHVFVPKVEDLTAIVGPQRVHIGEYIQLRAIGETNNTYTSNPLQWTTNTGVLTSLQAGEARIKAPLETGNLTVSAQVLKNPADREEVTISVYAEAPTLRFVNGIAESAIVPVNESVTLKATKADGSPYPVPLDWNATGGTITVQADGTAIFTAGTVTGDATISASPRNVPSPTTVLPVRVVQRITGETRFILTWGGSPADLDTHLWLPASTPYHVYYGRRGTDAACPYAQLDQDDTDGFGPEIMRVRGLTGSSGLYSLQVFNFSRIGTFTDSQAKIEVVSTATGEILTTVNVPQGGAAGNWWNVLTFDAVTGVINVVNTVGEGAEPYYDSTTGCTIQTQGRLGIQSMGTTQPQLPTDSNTKPVWTPGVSNLNRFK